MISILDSLIKDRAALYGVATRAVQGLAGLVTAVFIIRYFTPAEQGYYYTFSTLLALQIFIELGLSTVVTTFAAHEWARLSLSAAGAVEGDAGARARLGALTLKVAKWYAAGAGLLLALLLPAGAWFLDGNSAHGSVSWQMPWAALCVIAAASFLLTPCWAVLTGCGQLRTLNAFRLAETALRYALLWGCMALGASLWSAVLALAVSTLAGAAFLAYRYRRFISSVLAGGAKEEFDWLRELAPLQLRIAVSWISGYFAFSVFVPVMFHYHGADEAGRMGMAWALVAGLSGVAGTWLQVQAPRFAEMVARSEFAALDRAVWQMAGIGLTVFAAGGAVVLAGLGLLASSYPGIATRLIGLGPLSLFLLAELLHQISMVQSTYLRAFKQEPFLSVSVATGVIVGVGTVSLTDTLGAYGPAVSYLAAILVSVAWGTLIYMRNRRLWTRGAAPK